MEGDGGGMVAIVHGLGDAGLSVTLTGAQCKGQSERKDHPQYEFNQRHYHQPEYTQTYYSQHKYSQREPKNQSEYKQRDNNKQRRHVKLFGVKNCNFRPHHTTTAAVQTHTLGVQQKKESARIQDDTYTSSYQVAHCRAHPTASAAHSSEFPPQRISPYTNQGHFIVGGFDSGSGERGVGGSMCVQDSQSHRSVTWPDRSSSLYCARTPRGTDAFAESLRKYPSFSPERTPSADLVQKLLSYTQARNLAKGHSRSMRSLKRTSREINKENQLHVQKSSKNIEAYTKTKNEPSCDVKVNVKKNSPSPSSESRYSRHQDSYLNSTYDYLKCRSRFSGTEVRYFNDMSKFLKETIRHIIDNQPSCSGIADRYEQHKRECPGKVYQKRAGAMSVDAERQSSPRPSQEACTMAPFGTKGSNITLTPGPKMCCNCNRPLPCHCEQPCSSTRRLRFNTSNLVRINQIVCPEDDCPDEEPCSCPKLTPGDKIKERIIKWLNDIPLKANFTIQDKNKRDKMVRNLTNYLVHIKEDDDFELNAREMILKHLISLPIWYPCETDTDDFKNELAGNLIKRLLDLFNIQGENSKQRGAKDLEDTFKQELISWLEDIPEFAGRNASQRKDNEKLAKYYAEVLNKSLKIHNNNEEVRSHVKKTVKNLLDKALVMYNCKLDTITRDKYINEILRRLSSIIRRVEDNDELDLLEEMTEEDTIPELYGGDPIKNNKIIKKLAQNIQKLRAEGYSEKEIQKTIQNWVQNEGKWEGSKIDPLKLEDLGNVLFSEIDKMKELSLSKQNLIKELTRDIQEWVETISGLVGISEVENKEIIEKLAVEIRKLMDEGYSDEQIQKKTTTWVKTEVEKEGAKIDVQKLENLGNELSDKLGFESKLGNELVDKIERKDELVDSLANEIQDLVDIIPELVKENKADNKKIFKKLSIKMIKLKDKGRTNKEIEKEIKNWILDEVEKKGSKIDAKRLNNLGNQLVDKVEQEHAIDDIIDEILKWFEIIPESAGEDRAENKKMVNKLSKRIQKLKSDGYSEKEIQKDFKSWIKDEVEHKRGTTIDTRPLEKLGNELVDKILCKGELLDNLASEIQDWVDTIPELAGEDIAENKKIVNNFARRINKLKYNGCSNKEIQEEMKNWTKDEVEKKGGKIDSKRSEKLGNQLFDKIEQKQTIDDLSDEIVELFEFIPKLAGEDKAENNKFINKLAKKIQKMKASENSETEIQKNIQSWIKDEVKHKAGKIDTARLEKFGYDLIEKHERKDELIDNLADEIQDWVDTVPEIAGGNGAESKKNDNSLARRINELEKNKGRSNKEIQKEMKNGIKEQLEKKVSNIDANRLENLENQLIDRIEQKQAIDDLRDEDVEWFEFIPELAGEDKAENKRIVSNLAKRIQKVKVDGFSEKEIQKDIKNWIKDEVEKKGGIIDDKRLENLANQLVCKMARTEKYVDVKANEITKWIETTPELAGGEKDENKEMVSKLAKGIQKLKTDGLSEKNWVKDEVKKKGSKIDAGRLTNLENQLTNKIEFGKDLDNLGDEIQEWFETIPELVEEDKAENEKKANKLTKIKLNLKADEFSEKEIQKDIKDEIEKKGSVIDDKRLEKLRNELVDKMARLEESAEVIAYNIQEWFETIPELAGGDDAENKKVVSKLARKIQKLKAEGFSEKKIQKEIKKWVRDEVEKKGGKIDAVRLDSLGNPLAGAIESKKVLDDLGNEIQEWFETVQELTGDNGENKKIGNKLAKRVQQLTTERYSDKEIQKEIKNWVKEEVEKEGGKIDSKMFDKIRNELVRKVQRNLELLKNNPSLKQRKLWSKQSGHQLSLDDGQKASRGRLQFSSSTDRSFRSVSPNSKDSDGAGRRSTNRSLMRKGSSEATTQHPLSKLDTQNSEQKESHRKQFNNFKGTRYEEYYVDNNNKNSAARKSSVMPKGRNTKKRKKEIENLFDDKTLSEASKNLNKDTQRKVYEELAKNADKLLSPESDKIYQEIINILKEKTGLADKETVPLARTIFLKAKEIAMSKSDDDDDNWVTEHFGDILDEFGVTVNRKDIEANLLDFLSYQLRRGDFDDPTKGDLISILQKANLPLNETEELANTLNERIKELTVEGNRGPSTSTPRQSQKASGTEDFYPRRNTDDSLMSSINDSGCNKAKEQRYTNQLEDVVRDWVNSLDAIDDENVKENMVKDIAEDIVDRKKYLQLNPDAKTSKKDELENLKYQVFRWLNRVGVEDLTPFISNLSSLMIGINNVEVPDIGKQKNVEFLTNTIGSWLEEKPRNHFITDEKEFPRKMAELLAIQLQPLIDKPNLGKFIENEIAQWLLKVFNDVNNLNLLSGELKGLLMNGDGRYKTNQEFKSPADILYDLVDNWCQQLPIYGGGTAEEQEKVNTLKQNLASKIINKIGELNMNPETFNDDFLYEDLLKDEVDKLLSTVPRNPELEKYLPALKRDFISKVNEAKHKISDKLAGQIYRLQLRDNISKSIHLPENLSSEDQTSFEILKDNLADAFINLHYVIDSVEDRNNVKQKIGNEINRFCNDYLRRHPASPIDPCKLNQEMYKALHKVAIPKDESMRYEVEQIRIKDVINDWINELPLNDEPIAEQLHKNKMIFLLSKTLHEIEKVKENNPDLDSDAAMLEQISKFLKKLPLKRGQEINMAKYANALKNKLKNTEGSRRFNLSSLICPKAYPGLPPPSYARTIPPCSISQEDRDHLSRVRERNMTKKLKTSCYKDAYTNPGWVDTGSQNDLEVSCWGSYHTRNRSGTVCPGMSQTPSPIHPGSYSSMRGYSKRHSPCSQYVQHGYGSPQVVVKEYFWDANDTSQNQDALLQNFQGIHSSIPQENQPGSPHQNAGVARENQAGLSCVSPINMSPKQCQRPTQPPNQQFLTSYSSSYNNSHNNHISPRVSKSSAIRHSDICCCPQEPSGEDEVSCPYRSGIRSERQTRCRSPEVSSNDEQCPEGAGPSKKPRVVRLGSLDGIKSCPKVNKKQGSKKVSRDDESDWSSIKFPEDMSLNWNDCSRNRIYVSPSEHGPFLEERERREEKVKCKCKERVLTTCRGRKKRPRREICPFCHDDPSVKCSKCFGIYCPRPSFLYFRR